MAELDELLVRIPDAALRTALEAEIASLRADRKLGLVFERHPHEKVRLPELPIRRGTTVESRDNPTSPTWQVNKVFDGQAHLTRRDKDGTIITDTHPVAELVVVSEFGQPIFPGLKSVGRIERGADKPFHTVINAENHHALETLLYPCENTVDLIYIDPPYNTGARDWKYNNDYVDENDTYRHSKWLSFMEKRLRLAKRLLRPEDGTLIVTIDENEVARLTLLLEATFPTYDIVPVHIIHNPRGIQGDNFSFVHETALFVTPKGKKLVQPRALTEEEIREGTSPLRNWGGESRREDAANCFYPILVKDKTIVGFGDAVDRDDSIHPKHNVVRPDGVVEVWPIDVQGVERKWRYARQNVESIRHLLIVEKLRAGGMRGEIEIKIAKTEGKHKTIWTDPRYDASVHGSQLVKRLTGRDFPYPKSLYAVYDCINSLVANRPDALVVDFFSGSGTTAHAVAVMNRVDGGRRRTISVTNNEVGPDEARRLARGGFKPSDPEWEACGIFECITKPRLEAAIMGTMPSGEPIGGEYKLLEPFPLSDGLAENMEFFKLTYEEPDFVRPEEAFTSVAPLLWLMAGSRGPRIDKITAGWALPVDGRYGVLFDADAWLGFIAAVKQTVRVTHAFIVTDSDAVFQRVAAEVPATVTPVRLHESYLQSFAINIGAFRAGRTGATECPTAEC